MCPIATFLIHQPMSCQNQAIASPLQPASNAHKYALATTTKEPATARTVTVALNESAGRSATWSNAWRLAAPDSQLELETDEHSSSQTPGHTSSESAKETVEPAGAVHVFRTLDTGHP